MFIDKRMLQHMSICKGSRPLIADAGELQHGCLLPGVQAVQRNKGTIGKFQCIMMRARRVQIDLPKTGERSPRGFRPGDPILVILGRQIKGELCSSPQTYGGVRITNSSKASGYIPGKLAVIRRSEATAALEATRSRL